ncbi:MAG TPA: contractile injection system tape measure protein, partial [Acidobacteriota bacterium]|nr:contractile injection system tape measure protein [Acidobacteriota bacterium]
MYHSLRKQTFEIEAASEQLAMALQSSLGDINRRSLVPVIERVLNEVSIPGQTIKISKVKVDLGTIPFQQLEETAAKRLYHELLRALTDAIAEITQNPTPENRTRSKTESLLGQIEHFLVQGTLPFGFTGAGQFSFERQVLHLAETNPQGLVELVKTHSHQRYVIERLLYQLGET